MGVIKLIEALSTFFISGLLEILGQYSQCGQLSIGGSTDQKKNEVCLLKVALRPLYIHEEGVVD